MSESRSVVSDSLRPNGLYTWHSPGQNTGVGSCFLLQGIFPTPGLNPGLPHCRRILYQLSYQGSQNETLKVWPWWNVKAHKCICMQIYKYKMKMYHEFNSLVRKTPDVAKHPKDDKIVYILKWIYSSPSPSSPASSGSASSFDSIYKTAFNSLLSQTPF